MPKRKLSEAQATDPPLADIQAIDEQDRAQLDELKQDSPPRVRPRVPDGTPAPTPSRSILKKRGKINLLDDTTATPRSVRKVLFTDHEPATPVGAKTNGNGKSTDVFQSLSRTEFDSLSPLTSARGKDRSARRKSTLRLIEQAENGGEGDEAGLDIADRVLEDDDQDTTDFEELGAAQTTIDDIVADVERTPSKSRHQDTPTKKPPATSRKQREREPTPPLYELAPHEQYFFQNRPASCKTSTNTLNSTSLLSHEDYNTHIKAYVDPHADATAHLTLLHTNGLEQWSIELEQGFSVCLYGHGSKRRLMDEYAAFVWENKSNKSDPIIVIVNGYAHMLALTDILNQLARNLLPKTAKPPVHATALLSFLIEILHRPEQPLVHLMVSSIDARPMRKPVIQNALARLAACPRIHLLATADNPHFNLMWDTTLRSSFRFLFHDTTTFAPYTAEIDVVDTVNSLLGKSGRRLGGKDGVSYVLQSLPRKARDLFRILIAEQLAFLDTASEPAPAAAPEDDLDDEPFGDDDMDLDEPDTPSRRKKGRPPTTPKKRVKKVQTSAFDGIEVRTLYHKAVEQFACSSEMDFRTLLKEFHDHQMIESRGQGQGSERLLVPFAKEELEGLLESLI